jgi:hypothetical protein
MPKLKPVVKENPWEKRKNRTLKEKVEWLKMIENGATRKEVQEKFQIVSSSVLSDAIARKDEILKMFEMFHNVYPDRKRRNIAKYPELETILQRQILEEEGEITRKFDQARKLCSQAANS